MNVRGNGDGHVLMTIEGHRLRVDELERLRTQERRRLAELVREARGDGDLDDNPTLVELLDERAQLEQRIAMLEAQLAVVEVAPPPRGGRAAVGTVVRVRDLGRGESFDCELVGPLEGDPAAGRISTASPIGRALIGQSSGSYIEVGTPQGVVALQVLDVRVPGPTLTRAAA